MDLWSASWPPHYSKLNIIFLDIIDFRDNKFNDVKKYVCFWSSCLFIFYQV